jgi:hypothetical protein
MLVILTKCYHCTKIIIVSFQLSVFLRQTVTYVESLTVTI